MVYLLRCDSPKSEGGASTPDSAPDRSRDTGELDRQKHRAVMQCQSGLRIFALPESLICFCISGVCLHRYGSGRNCLFYREAESSNGIATTSHGPPTPLTDHHTSESVCSRPFRNDFI